MEFIRHKNFARALISYAFAITSMMNFQFLEHLLATTALNVQEQPFAVVLHKTSEKFHKIHSNTPVADPLF